MHPAAWREGRKCREVRYSFLPLPSLPPPPPPGGHGHDGLHAGMRDLGYFRSVVERRDEGWGLECLTWRPVALRYRQALDHCQQSSECRRKRQQARNGDLAHCHFVFRRGTQDEIDFWLSRMTKRRWRMRLSVSRERNTQGRLTSDSGRYRPNTYRPANSWKLAAFTRGEPQVDTGEDEGEHGTGLEQ